MTEPSAEASEADAERFAAIEDLLSFVDIIVPTEVAVADPMAEVLACAAIRRLAELLQAETLLAVSGGGATSRVVGRSAIEAWLWACYLILDPEAATDRLFAESLGHQRRLARGIKNLWDAYEEIRAAVVQEPLIPSSDGSAKPRVDQLASLVAAAREHRGFDTMRSIGMYEETYRFDSVHDVHPSLEMLIRYFTIDDLHERATVFARAQPDPADIARGLGGAFDTARLLLDALAVYRHSHDLQLPPEVHQRLLDIVELP